MGTSYTGTTPLKTLESRKGREGEGGEEGRSVNVPRGKDERSSKRGAEKKNRNELTGSYRVQAVICGTGSSEETESSFKVEGRRCK